MRVCASITIAALAGCGGGGGSDSPPLAPAPTYTVGGSVSGLAGTGLALTVNGSNTLSINANGAFTFSAGLASGSSYTVAVATQPGNPSQVCSVSAGAGSIATSNVTTVNVTCGFAGRFAYVVNNGLNQIDSIAAYSINRSSGLLTPLAGSPYSVARLPISAAVHPNDKFLYVASAGNSPANGMISVLSINQTTGALTHVGGSPFVAPTPLYQIAIDATGKFAFTANFTSPNVSAFTLDANTGVPTPVAGSPFACVGSPISVAVDPSSRFVYVGTQGGGPNNSGAICAYTVNATTGALTPVAGSPFAAGAAVSSIAVDPTGKFAFATGNGAVLAYTLNATSGALTPVTGSPFATGSAAQTIAIDPAGKFVYVGHNSLGSHSLIFGFSIDAATGALAPVPGSPFASSDTPFFITIDPSGDLAYVANLDSDALTVYSINRTSGALGATGPPIANGIGTNPAAIAILR